MNPYTSPNRVCTSKYDWWLLKRFCLWLAVILIVLLAVVSVCAWQWFDHGPVLRPDENWRDQIQAFFLDWQA